MISKNFLIKKNGIMLEFAANDFNPFNKGSEEQVKQIEEICNKCVNNLFDGVKNEGIFNPDDSYKEWFVQYIGFLTGYYPVHYEDVQINANVLGYPLAKQVGIEKLLRALLPKDCPTDIFVYELDNECRKVKRKNKGKKLMAS